MALVDSLTRRWRAAPKAARLLVVAVPPLLIAVAGACLISVATSPPADPQARAVEQAVRRMEKAMRDSDVEEFRAATTDEFYRAQLAISGPAAIFSPGEPELALGGRTIRRIETIRIEGDTATVDATVRGTDALNVDAVTLRLARRQGTWLVDYAGMRKLTNTGGAQAIDVTMSDFLFQPEPLAIERDTRLTLRVKNTGAQPHMVGIWLVPEDHELIKLIEATDVMPAGVERIVNSQVFAAGDEGDILLAEGFKPGRYMLTCFLSDITSPILTPHYDIGMLTEFEVR